MKLKLTLLLILSVVVSLTASAQRWEKLGEQTVNFKTERDVIRCGHKGTFTALRFHVEHAPVEFDEVEVEFANGQKQKISIRQEIRAGGESRVIDLRGNSRVIKEINFRYSTEKKAGGKVRKAKVIVMGRN